MRTALSVLILLSTALDATPSRACANPYMGRVVGAVPAPGSQAVYRDATIGFWLQELWYDQTGPYPSLDGAPYQITLERVSTGEEVSGQLLQVDSPVWEAPRGVAFVPDQPLAANELYRVPQIDGYEFTTGDSFAPQSEWQMSGGSISVSVSERRQPHHAYCDNRSIGACPSGLVINYSYPVWVTVNLEGLRHPVPAPSDADAFRYEVRVQGGSKPLAAAVPGPQDESVDLEFKMSTADDEVCFVVVAVDLAGNDVDQTPEQCAKRSEATTLTRSPKPDISGYTCDEYGMWVEKDGSQTDPPGTDPPGTDPPGTDPNDPQDPDGSLPGRGCAVGAAPVGSLALWLLALGLMWRRRR